MTDACVGADSCEAVLAEVEAAIDRLVELDWSVEAASATEGHVRRVGQLADRLSAADAGAVGAFEAAGEWVVDGHRSARVALRHTCGQSTGSAKRRVDRARWLRGFGRFADGLAAGDVSADKVDVLVRVDNERVHDGLVDAEGLLVELAVSLPFEGFVVAVNRFVACADPDGADQEAAQRDKDRNVMASTSIGGRVRLDGWLTPLGGAEFKAELARLEQQLFTADWAEARDRLGDTATTTDLTRTAGQRRHDALVEMARRSATADIDGAGPAAKPSVLIHVDHATFIAELAALAGRPLPTSMQPDWSDRLCELDDRAPIAPTEMLNAALGGEVRRIVFGADGQVLDYGRARRLFTGAVADAIRARDRTCRMPGCHLPASRCEIDHIQPWSQRGETTVDNGQCLCPAFQRQGHNRWKHLHPQRYQRVRRPG